MEYSDYELVYMVKENEDALEYMLKKYEPLFRKFACSFAFKCKNSGTDVEDIVQYCRIVFCRVVDMYDPENEVLFISYLMAALKRSIMKFVERCARKVEEVYYMDLEDYDNLDFLISSHDTFESCSEYEMEQSIKQFANTLTALDGRVFELRYNGFSYKDIASLLELDVKKVDNILFKIRKKLEKYFLFS